MGSTDLARVLGSRLALHKRAAHRGATGCGANMALRHGLEGGPTTGRVLAGLIRPRVSDPVLQTVSEDPRPHGL